jgi:Putative auto-transporter adhesin, head GIN domain
MKSIFSAVFLLSMFIAGAQKTLVNDPNAVPREISGGFNAIKISGGIDLYLSQYETESMAVSATEEKYRNNIKTVVENGTLKIYYDSDLGWTKGNKKLKVYLSFKSIEKITASGACDIHVAGTITVPRLLLDLNGASDFKGSVAVDEFSLELSGASDVTVAGTATNVKIQSSGASDVKAYDLISDYCTARASGASDIKITVNKELNADAGGASDISFKGNGVIKNIQSGGASSVSRRN